ncbi:MAG: hypothetical protein HFI36_06745 [Bacilli bacterium]|jgi:hypothetical protein|nr:hypothetical protein [Bacilli bacterium]
MLKELKILNGELSLEFDSLNTIYTVNLSNDDNMLLLEYKIDENDNISIKGNNLIEGKNEVVITVYNDKNSTSYYLEVYKDSSTNVVLNTSKEVGINVAKTEMPDYVVPSIAVVCFLTILFLFVLLFKKSKK